MNEYQRVYAKINLDALHDNMEAMHNNLKPGTRMFAVIKTDGYGHGAVPLALELESLDYLFGFCVATVEEGLELRQAGITKPILILGYTFPQQYEVIVKQNLSPAVFTYEMAEQLSRQGMIQNKDVTIHIAVDTGMSRIGYYVNEKNAKEVGRISRLPHIIMEGIFTHFAKADELDKTSANHQLEEFNRMIRLCNQEGVIFHYHHCSNSAGIVEMPQANMDLVRAGITLYGLWPSDEVSRDVISLKPLLSLKSHISYIKPLPPGKSVSYGGTYTADSDRVIATIPVGYGDGYPRSLSNKGDVLIHGKRCRILGRICMDQFMVDVTELKNVSVGDEVTLIGKDGQEEITAEELGMLSGRFNYELVCDLSSRRIPRVYEKGDKVCIQRDYF